MSAAFKCDVCRSLREGSPSASLVVEPRDLYMQNTGLKPVAGEICSDCARDILVHIRDIPSRAAKVGK